ncbi:MAG: formimidoylglutamase [Flavobacteriales bacterium]|nr:formimidoylglutamase [Flavobacteriales bacterium]MCB9447822.1 formimidoylglutamase [Flavobacteriales bacterium]
MYHAPDTSLWKGRHDGDEPSHHRYHHVVRPLDMGADVPQVSGMAFALLGFSSDEGVKRNKGRAGAAEGPNAIRAALANLPFHAGTDVIIVDAGDVICDRDQLEAAQVRLAEAVKTLLQAGYFPLVMGGGHEVSFGHYMGLHQAHPESHIGIFNFDAHFDLRDDKQGATSGTPFTQIAGKLKEEGTPFSYCCAGIEWFGNTAYLFEQAKGRGVQYLFSQDVQMPCPESSLKSMDDFLASVDRLYVTLCLDVFSASVAPGVSAPNPAGLLPRDVQPLLERLLRSGKVLSMDVAEMNPAMDRDGITARLAAIMLDQVIRTRSDAR